jgi:hypothetical protein
MGLFVGALAIPEIESKAVRNPTLFQTVVGTISGTLAAIAFDASNVYIFYASIIGAFIGFTASFWVKHMPIP